MSIKKNSGYEAHSKKLMDDGIAFRTRSGVKLYSNVKLNSSNIMKELELSRKPKLRRRTTGCQTSVLDNITIVNVKAEADEVDVSPPILQREVSGTPELPTSSQRSDISRMDYNSSEESLRSLFDFLHNTVKKFPPQLQAQVKVDLFRTVTEAEMKLSLNGYAIATNGYT